MYSRFSRIFVLTALIILFFFVSNSLINQFLFENRINSTLNCGKEYVSDYRCLYSCQYEVFCQGNVTSRLRVIHSGFVALYDEKKTIACGEGSFNLELPFRRQEYSVRLTFYNDKGFGNQTMELIC